MLHNARHARRTTSPPSGATTTTVGFLLVPGFALLSYASAVEPLRAANQIGGRTLYRWWHAAPGDSAAVASNGAAVNPDLGVGTEVEGLDLMLVCAGGNPSEFRDKGSFSWLRKLARQGVTIGGISGGPFILARAGLLAGRRCTVHWEHMPAFQEAFPDIELTRSLFTIDGTRITCAGGIAALDMMVALIARDHGYELAAAVSDWFLHTQIREGSGPQRMDLRHRLRIADERVLTTLRAMEANLERPLSRSKLAQLSGLSLRQLERAFRDKLQKSIHQHYLGLRLTQARRLLVETPLQIIEIAVTTGFRAASNFTRAFRNTYGMSPRDYQRTRLQQPEAAGLKAKKARGPPKRARDR